MQESNAISRPLRRRGFLKTSAQVLASCLTAGSLKAAFDDSDVRLRLLARADDIGSTRSLNRAVKQCVTKGIARNVSVLAPTPFVQEAAELLARLKGVCFGLHTTLNSEWTNLRWGPVAPRESVRSLLDKDGMLHQYPRDLKNVDVEEALVEFTAQLQRAKKLGFDICYADSHMGGINRVPKLAQRFRIWCRSNKIIDFRIVKGKALPGIPRYWSRPDHRKDADFPSVVLQSLKSAPRKALYVIVGHPGYDDDETRRLGHDGYPGFAVASNLNLERLAFVSPDIMSYCKTEKVRLIRYDEAVIG